MKFISILTCLVISITSIAAKIVECDHFQDLFSYAEKDTLLILDIDDTILIPVQMLGCDQWFQYRFDFHRKNNLSAEEALEKSLAEWEGVRHLTKMTIVEPNTTTIIQELQANEIPIMGLTTQGLALTTRTHLQLLEQKVDLSQTAPSQEDHYFPIDDHGVLYRNGILFTSGKNKGEAFFKLCELLNYQPKKIVFLNDKWSHLRELEEAAIARAVEFIGLRYGYSDTRKRAFLPEIAEYQFTHSPITHFLSDEEAARKQFEESRGLNI